MVSLILAAAIAGAQPTTATVRRTGYWTILSAPPAPFVARPPDPPPAPDARQKAASDLFWRYAKWQGQVSGVAATVHNFLLEREKGNYVDMRYSGSEDGRFRVVYSFLRDGPGTLRKYISRPDFEAETVRFSKEELIGAMERMDAYLREEKISFWGGTTVDKVEIRLGITKEEFRALQAKRKWEVPAPVELQFTEKSSTELNRPLPTAIAPHIRYFARATQPTGPVHDINSLVTVVLQDGCFRLAGDERAHVQFPLGENLFVDRDGYLAFGETAKAGYARVGEPAVFHGSKSEVTDPGVVAPIVRACGPGKVIAVNRLKSAAVERSEDIAREHGWLRRSLPESYGLSARATEAFIRDCAARFGGRCIMSPPPPPFEPCPPGSAKSQGMCRTPQGHIRPVPKELEPYLKL